MNPNPAKWLITTFYKFRQINNLQETEKALYDAAKEFHIHGLLILGKEGINCTCSATSAENLNNWKKFIQDFVQSKTSGEVMFKDSESDFPPFRRFKVKQRDEIVTIGAPDLTPETQPINHHLTPTEWNKVLKEETDFVMLDTRNWYEYKIGTFKGALDPKIDQFTEFPEWVDQQNYDKNKKMLIFCTGGIRCEKGILELQRRGYNNVYQLEGGILKYIEEYPNDQFLGECFVFDQRVAVDQDLKPSKKYKLCPHCGNPAEIKIDCIRCDSEAYICEDCQPEKIKGETCSKNCAHWWDVFPGKKGAKQVNSYVTHANNENRTQP